jgi:hypothetical protein
MTGFGWTWPTGIVNTYQTAKQQEAVAIQAKAQAAEAERLKREEQQKQEAAYANLILTAGTTASGLLQTITQQRIKEEQARAARREAAARTEHESKLMEYSVLSPTVSGTPILTSTSGTVGSGQPKSKTPLILAGGLVGLVVVGAFIYVLVK